MTQPNTPSRHEIDAAFDWWRDAGVDCDFADDAREWLGGTAADAGQTATETKLFGADASGHSSVRRAPENVEASPAEKIDLLGESPPQTLEEFAKFWLEAPGLDAIGPRGRIPARGNAGADLMVLVLDPEEADRTTLLSGRQGRLLGKILAAMGVAEGNCYIASALPRHTPMADSPAIAHGGMGLVTLHHIALAAPRRVIAFGSSILPLIGHDPAQDISSLREINHESFRVPLLVSEGLDSMLSMPRLKARFWRRWIEWSDG